MPEIPPWLVPPNFIGAAEGGARLGLSARSQDIEEQSAADRLKLAYDQLAKQERVASMQAQQKLQLGEAANKLRMAHEEALQSHYQTMQDTAAEAAQTASEKLKQPKLFHYKGQILSVDPSNQAITALNQREPDPLKLSPDDSAIMQSLKSRLVKLEDGMIKNPSKELENLRNTTLRDINLLMKPYSSGKKSSGSSAKLVYDPQKGVIPKTQEESTVDDSQDDEEGD